jgi:hypothetical protein
MDSRTWTRAVTTTDPVSGMVTSALQSYQELGNGICYQGPSGVFLDSQDVIDLTDSGAQATHGPMPAAFSGDIADASPITLFPPVTASGPSSPLKLAPIGLFYYDPTPPGKIAQIGLFQPSQGQLHGDNVLVYPDVIPGLADLMVVWTHGGLEDSVIIKKGLADPASYGLSAACRLQYWAAYSGPLPTEQRPVLLNSGLTDHLLIFDGYWMPVGGVFPVGQTPLASPGQAAQIRLIDPADPAISPLAKSLVNISGQNVLIEEIQFADIQAQLKTLGLASAPPTAAKVVEFAARAELLPPTPQPKATLASVRLASAPYLVNGLAMDPYITLSNNTNSYTFAAGSTYYIPSSFTVGSGQATFQNNACIKLATNAYLLVYGKVSFPASGAQVQFNSKDDNGIGSAINGSSSEPSYAANPGLWMYYQTVKTTVQNTSFRWAQRGIRYDENSGMGTLPQLSSSAFENCSTGVYQNTPGDTLTLSSDTYCNVGTPIYSAAGSVSGSINNDCGTPTTNLLVDASQITAEEGEPAIAVDPANPQNLFMAANYWSGPAIWVGWASSTNGGTNWSSFTALANSHADPSVAYDSFGNLFVCYLDANNNVIVLSSTNNASSFTTSNAVLAGHFDWTRIATGPGAVWVTSYDYGISNTVNSSVVNGASVTGPGVIGEWTNIVHISNTTPDPLAQYGLGYGWGDIAVGPTGQVALVVQNGGAPTNGPTQFRISVNPYGLRQSTAFAPAWTNLTNQVGFGQWIPAQANKKITPTPALAWDRTGGPYRGRLYMAYTDWRTSGQTNTDIYVTHSDDNGTNWIGTVKVNTDTTTTSQFFPRIAVDQASGKVAVGWYDCRADTANNRETQFYAAVSSDGGVTFLSSNLLVQPSQSDIRVANPDLNPFDYFDYSGLTYYGGYFYLAWADNSNSTGNNPDTSTNNAMDINVAKVRY